MLHTSAAMLTNAQDAWARLYPGQAIVQFDSEESFMSWANTEPELMGRPEVAEGHALAAQVQRGLQVFDVWKTPTKPEPPVCSSSPSSAAAAMACSLVRKQKLLCARVRAALGSERVCAALGSDGEFALR